jgi:hypothetical protein
MQICILRTGFPMVMPMLDWQIFINITSSMTKCLINSWISNMTGCGWGGKHPNDTTQENELWTWQQVCYQHNRTHLNLVGTSHSIWKYSSLANELAMAVLWTVPRIHWTSVPQITIHEVTWNNGIWMQDELLQWISDATRQSNSSVFFKVTFSLMMRTRLCIKTGSGYFEAMYSVQCYFYLFPKKYLLDI